MDFMKITEQKFKNLLSDLLWVDHSVDLMLIQGTHLKPWRRHTEQCEKQKEEERPFWWKQASSLSGYHNQRRACCKQQELQYNSQKANWSFPQDIFHQRVRQTN